MDGFMELIKGVADVFEIGDSVKGALGEPAAYAQGRSMQTGDGPAGEVPYVYERVLTRPRTLNINDR
jgi:hypothetical protein